jgi:F0F1-type ATP synthase assembly protein I
MKHLIHKINFDQVKQQIKAVRFAIPELIAGFVIGILLGVILS